MTILIQNLTANEIKYVYRFNGSKLHIGPQDFICFESFNTEEIMYWSKQASKSSNNKELRVVLDTRLIKSLQKLKANGLYNHKPVTPVIPESPVDSEEDSLLTITNVDTESEKIISDNSEDIIVEDDTVESKEVKIDTTIKYTQEYLDTLTKDDIKQILEERNIPYKNNNSLKTLIALILNDQE